MSYEFSEKQRRAQEMCNRDGKRRYVVFCSSGWRIELEVPGAEVPHAVVDPVKALTAPRLNLNGTDGEALWSALLKASRAVADAKSALQETYPHGRDYQTYEDPAEALRGAQEEYRLRLVALDTVHGELQELATNVWNQRRERAGRKAAPAA